MTHRPPWHPSMSDGCSVPKWIRAMVPVLDDMCEQCYLDCLEHDEAYYNGGTEEERHLADSKLYAKILPKIGEKWAVEWYTAVRNAGASHWGTGRAWDGRLLWKQQAEEQQSP